MSEETIPFIMIFIPLALLVLGYSNTVTGVAIPFVGALRASRCSIHEPVYNWNCSRYRRFAADVRNRVSFNYLGDLYNSCHLVCNEICGKS